VGALIGIGVPLLYLVIAGVVARRVFVGFVNEHGRDAIQDLELFWAGVAWPVYLSVGAVAWLWTCLIKAPTANERALAKAKADKKARKEAERVAEELGLPGLGSNDRRE
jgi:hypothetical protein